ncbi:LysR family transcriptional regulator [Achromobacter sp. AONIH1]|uniref:LysR family transcriptional regulator n=1 Tax=Achromobacter sp. AONIH1 TaxID=1758194 RepID=UPI000CD15342|nr:LysR family transcriptional regulator [Achromobacter sp. AONIH1]AUT48510.1 LysR family transcriptional regulator [Achromobacter sp. AONIH1]
MSSPDFNLLITLDVLLAEGSVARAARRLRLSPSAMSRALARLRETTGDPLLVRAGRGLVPTPRALALRAQVGQLVRDAEAVLRPAELPDLARLERVFTLRAQNGFVEAFGARLLARLAEEAPDARLRFVPKTNKLSDPLRDGEIDLDIGVVGDTAGPELYTRALFRDRHVGVVRAGHALARGKVSAARYASGAHVMATRRGLERGPVDEALAAQGLSRRIAAYVGGYAEALALARDSDLIATVPEKFCAALLADMRRFALPVELPAFTVSMLWHPRMDADPAHRWLRACLHQICTARDNRR